VALTKNHAAPLRYIKGGSPADSKRLDLHVHDELRKIELSLQRIATLLPQAAAAEPSEKFIGMIRYAIASSWDPLSGAVDAWVYYDGSNWVAL
jgi:hypothetical protein